MQQARKLVLVDEFDKEYKRLQRSADAVAKTDRSLQLSDTLRQPSPDDDRKVREYVAALHRYLTLAKRCLGNRPQRSIRSPNRCCRRRRHRRPNQRGMSHRRRRQSDRLANDENAKSGHPTDMEDIYVDVRTPGSFGGKIGRAHV